MAKKKKSTAPKVFAFALAFIIAAALAAVYIPNKLVPVFERKYRYPKEYSEYVEKYSQEYSLDENFIYAVIKVESNFDPNAESEVGAVGLMQLMNIAYKEVYSRIDDNKGLKYKDMYDPENNIMFGTFYLNFLYDHFGSYELAVAAYHAGMTEVRNWLDGGIIDADNLNIDDIPSDVTRHYVSKVAKAYKAYNRLYE